MVSLVYNRGRRTGPVVEIARALALGMQPGLMIQQGIPPGYIRRAQRKLGMAPTV